MPPPDHVQQACIEKRLRSHQIVGDRRSWFVEGHYRYSGPNEGLQGPECQGSGSGEEGLVVAVPVTLEPLFGIPFLLLGKELFEFRVCGLNLLPRGQRW